VQEDAGEKKLSWIYYFLILRVGVNYVSKNLFGVSLLSIHPMYRPSSPRTSTLGSKVFYIQDWLMTCRFPFCIVLYRLTCCKLTPRTKLGRVMCCDGPQLHEESGLLFVYVSVGMNKAVLENRSCCYLVSLASMGH